MLQNFRTGNRTLFGNVTDQNYGGIALLSRSRQQLGGISNLGNRTGGGRYSGAADGLDRIDDYQPILAGGNLVAAISSAELLVEICKFPDFTPRRPARSPI